MKNYNPKIWNQLLQSYNNNKLSHAYLFYGPEYTGKFNLALEFSKLVSQSELEKEQIENGAHPDIFVIQPKILEKKEKKIVKNISIEQIKELMQKIGLYAYQSPYKFLIVNKAERMTLTAANSLLKLIEEPPKDTIIILTASSLEGVLPTIRSRTQRIQFGLLKDEEIENILKSEFPQLAEEKLNQIVELSRGRIRLALQYCKSEEVLTEASNFIEKFRASLRTGLIAGLALAENLSTDKTKMLNAIDQWLWYLSKFLRKNIDENADIKIQRKIFNILKELILVRDRIKNTNANERLQLENFFVRIS